MLVTDTQGFHISALFLFRKKQEGEAGGLLCDVDSNPVFPRRDLRVSCNAAYVSTAGGWSLSNGCDETVNPGFQHLRCSWTGSYIFMIHE